MTKVNIEKEVARLDGLLNGIAVFSGKIRDYSAFSYIIEKNEYCNSVELSIEKFFSNQAKLAFSNVKYLNHGLRDLEHEIRNYLIRDSSYINADDLLRLNKYLSFKVMDLISVILDGYRDVEIFKMDSKFESSSSQCVFFCIQLKETIIVLQFNNDIEFKKQQTRKADKA